MSRRNCPDTRTQMTNTTWGVSVSCITFENGRPLCQTCSIFRLSLIAVWTSHSSDRVYIASALTSDFVNGELYFDTEYIVFSGNVGTSHIPLKTYDIWSKHQLEAFLVYLVQTFLRRSSLVSHIDLREHDIPKHFEDANMNGRSAAAGNNQGCETSRGSQFHIICNLWTWCAPASR